MGTRRDPFEAIQTALSARRRLLAGADHAARHRDPAADPRTAGQRAADGVAGFSGSWRFVFLHVAWFVAWLALRLDINLLTLVVSLEAIFLATFVLMSQNRQAARVQAQADRTEHLAGVIAAIVPRIETMASVDHVEHGRLLRDIHSHTTCSGHTTIESGGVTPAPAPRSHHKKARP